MDFADSEKVEKLKEAHSIIITCCLSTIVSFVRLIGI